MPQLVDGLLLNQTVSPLLLEEFKNYNDAFLVEIPTADQSAVNTDGLRKNKLLNNVDFIVNATEDFEPKSMDGQHTIIPWDKLDTTPTSMTDTEARSLAFDKASEIKKKHADRWKMGFRDYVISKLSPKQASDNMPVLRTTGQAVTEGGRLRLTFADMVKFYNVLSTMNGVDASQLVMILSAEHQQDLLEDMASTNNYRNGIRFDANGILTGFYSMKAYQNNAAPIYTGAGVLKATGSVKEATDRSGSIVFYKPNSVRYVESVKIQYNPMSQDTRRSDPKEEFRLHAYGLCDKVQEYGFGAIVSG